MQFLAALDMRHSPVNLISLHNLFVGATHRTCATTNSVYLELVSAEYSLASLITAFIISQRIT